MLLRVTITWAALVGIIGGTAYVVFPWYNVNAILLLAIASAIVGGIAVLIVRLRQNAAGGGSSGAGGARASKQSKGARRDR